MSSADARARLDPPASVRLCDAAVAAYATWTLACHAVVFAGGSLRVLVWVASVAAAAGAALAWRRRRRAFPSAGGDGAAREVESFGATEREGATRGPLRIAAAVAGAALVCVLAAVSSSIAVPWTAAVLLLVVALIFDLRRDRGGWQPAGQMRGAEMSLWLLAAVCAAVPLLTQHPSADDAFYVNLAVGAADAPDAPLLAHDTMFGIPGLPLILPVYRMHSFELLAGALAWLTPLTAIEACHFVLAALFGLLAPLAIARLARLAAPRTWIWVVAGVVAILLLAGGPPRWYSNFGLVLLHEGKAVFVTVMVPLLFAYALEFAREPGARSWLRLLAAHVAAVGVSATAAWAAPAAAGLGLIAGCLTARRGLSTLFLGATASAYVLALGMALRSGTVQSLGTWTRSLEMTGRTRATPPDAADPTFLTSNWTDVMGEGAFAVVCLLAMLSAWAFCNSTAGRRLALVATLGFLVLFNPFAAPYLAEHVTGNITFFRVFWVLPLPFLLALVLASPLDGRWPAVPRGVRIGVTSLAAVLILTLLPSRAVIAQENHVRLALLALDVPPSEYEAAARLVASVPPKSRVHAPKEVSAWVGTFHEHPYALVPRVIYAQFLSPHVGEEEMQRRIRLAHAFYREVLPPESAPALELLDALKRYDLSGVCIPSDAEGTRRILQAAGWTKSWGGADYEVWIR